MKNITGQEIKQVSNIVGTLVEATEHLYELARQKEFVQSLYTFSSIVEGYQAIHQVLTRFTGEAIPSLKNQLDLQIGLLAGHFEKQELLKINEILQFSFLPTMRKISEELSSLLNEEDSREIIVGVYNSFANPKDFYPEPRTMALVTEAEKQQVTLLFFTSADVNFEKKEIHAEMFVEGEWKETISRFPDVINNVGVGKRTQVERKLRRMIPFTSFHVGNKFTLPKRLLENRKYAELLVPFTVAMDKKQVYAFLEKNHKSVFKALKSNRGEDIYFVTKKGERFAVSEHKNEKIFSKEGFDEWLETIILAEKGSYIVQRFILTRTKADEPYHFRAHVQKNGEGQWALTHIYPRVGAKESNLSNVVTDGYVADFHEFMMSEFDDKGPAYEEEILRLSIEVAQHLDKLYGFAVDELGIDFAIDDAGRIWMHEANNGPQTAFHEEKRAVQTIAYAKYIAENGIFYDEVFKKSQLKMFQAKKSKIPMYDSSQYVLMGVLDNRSPKEEFLDNLAVKAEHSEMTVCVFKPIDVDFDQMLVKSKIWLSGKWEERITEYPDIILDKLQWRGEEDAAYIYEELEDIPFLNALDRKQLKRSEIFNVLRGNMEIEQLIPDYQVVTKTRDITKLLEEENNIRIELDEYSKRESYVIQTVIGSKYLVDLNGKRQEYNGVQLRNKLNEELTKNTHIILPDFRSMHNDKLLSVEADMLIDEDDRWNMIDCHALEDGQKSDELLDVFKELFAGKSSEILKHIEQSAEKISTILSQTYQSAFISLALEFSVSESGVIKLVNIQPNNLRNLSVPDEFVELLVARAGKIAQQK